MNVAKNHNSNQTLAVRVLNIQTALLPVVIFGVLIAGYKGLNWTEVFSFRVDDGWCRTGIEGIGRHCFGDFGLAFNRGNFSDVYSAGNLAAANSPLTALVFEFLRLFSYNIALAIYLGSLILSLFLSIYWATFGYPMAVRLSASAVLGIGGIGALSAIDRGNHVAILIPLGLAYVISLERGKWNQAVFCLVLISMLKFWGIILVIGLVSQRRYKDSLKAVFFSAFGTLALLAIFPGDFYEKISAMTKSVTNQDYAAKVSGYATSTHGLVKRISCSFSTEDWCNTEAHARSFLSSSLASLVIMILLIMWCIWLFRLAKAPLEIWGTAILTLPLMAVPDAPTYNTAFAVAICALLFWSSTRPNFSDDIFQSNGQWKKSGNTLIWVIAISQIPITIFISYTGINGSGSIFSSGTSDVPPLFRLNYWTTPALWVLFLIVTIIEGSQAIRSSKQ